MVGCGSVAEVKSAPAYQQTPGFVLQAVASRTPARAADYAARHGVPDVYDDPLELIHSPSVDAVYIATPPDSHEHYGLEVAQAGKVCCIEKPLAPSYEACVRIRDAFKTRGLPLFVAYYRRSLPRFQKVKEWLDNGAIGEPRTVTWTFAKPASNLDRSGKPNWRTDAAVAPGGYFDDLASHGLDLITHLLGDVQAAVGLSTNQQGLYSAKDAVTGSWLHTSGVVGSGSWTFGARERRDHVEILGSEGEVTFSVFGELPLTLRGRRNEQVFIENPKHIQLFHVRNMQQHLAGGTGHPSTGDSAAHTAWVMEKILRGFRTFSRKALTPKRLYSAMADYPDSAFVGVSAQAQSLTKTQILVLATTHLETLGSFSPRLLDTLVGKLEAYKPDAIAAENLSPELVAMLEPEGGIYTEIVQKFAPKRLALALEAQKLLGLERLQAKEEAKNLSAKRGAETLSFAENVRLILSLIAAYDLNNAALTWGYLSAGERQGAANDMAGLAVELDAYLERPSEVVQIALRLAARLGHRQVHYFDDHRDWALSEFYGERINEIDEATFRQYIGQIPELGEAGRLFDEGLERGDLWEHFAYINTPEFMRALVDTEVGIYYRLKLPSGIDRMRAAQWETRNLYMAGNLRLASALYPGGRVLAVVGSSHKPLLDRYLAELTDVQLVRLGDL